MKRFAQLFQELDTSNKTNDKVRALVRYFQDAEDVDKLWAIALFTHRRPKRTITTSLLRLWAAEMANISTWLFEESYHIVGDLAETIALILPQQNKENNKPLHQWIADIKAQKNQDEDIKKQFIIDAWSGMNKDERFLFNKLLTGGFRIGVSDKLITKALAKVHNQEESKIAHRLMGNWQADDVSYQSLLVDDNPEDDLSKPYPFYLAYALDDGPESLGNISDWQIERKWDGIRGQLIKRSDKLFVWSRGEELVTDKYPEFRSFLDIAGDFVLDGEILPFKDGRPMSFHALQTRIGRKTVAKKHLVDTPVSFMAYDILELGGIDLREQPIHHRRQQLEALHASSSTMDSFLLSEVLTLDNWDEAVAERARSRALDTEGLMLKRQSSIYQVGRKRGDWWKWKVDPMTVDAVMIYAQRGHGRRSNLYTDFTFAAWDGERLVPFAKAYSGLTDKEFGEVTRFVQKNTIDRFGPVRSVTPELVFELAFEGINESKRHKSGIALRFPRIKRWRRDKPAKEANTLADLKALLTQK